jgi:hypothetical protein
MVGGPGLRFALEAAFLIALAVVAGLAELSPTTIVLVMGAAWLLVAVIEWLAWREGPRITRVRDEAVPAPVAQAVPTEAQPEPEPSRRRRFWRRRGEDDEADPVELVAPKAVAAPVAGEDTQDFEPPQEQPAAVPADERAGT